MHVLHTDAIIATDVSLSDYMEQYAAQHCEWVEGVVIKMSPVHIRHDAITRYLATLLTAYLELRPIGVVLQAPFVMALLPDRRREPDIQVVLNSNPHELKDTYMDGPADIVIEVVSPESKIRDHGEKFDEYEKGGVKEYWIVDPLRDECRFYRMNAEGTYIRQVENSDGNYHTSALEGLSVHVPTLWQDDLPGPGAVFASVQGMVG